jgi:hypothetical protein
MPTEQSSETMSMARQVPGAAWLTALWLGLMIWPLAGSHGAEALALAPDERAAMISRAVRYLAASQREDGTWSDTHGDQPGVLALAGLAFLASGEDALAGAYAQNLERCLKGMLAALRAEDGFIGESMYNHALSTLALAELYGELADERIGTVLPQAVRLLLRAQSGNARGAWRYTPRSLDADAPVTAACLVALAAAHRAGQNLPASAVERASAFLAECRNADGGWGYTGPGESAAPRTAACTLALALLRGSADPEVQAGCAYLERQGAGSAQYPFYYRLHASLALAVVDPHAWTRWDCENALQLHAAQGANGSWGGPQGTVFSTAAAVLSLTAGQYALPAFSP